MVDVSERLTAEPHRAEELLLIERDLSLAVSASSSLIEVLDLLLSAMCLIGGIDCGGVYLVDPSTGALRLVAHTGLSPEFVERSSRYDGGSSQAQRVMASAPIYVLSTNLPATDLDLREREGLRAIAVIPVTLKGEVVAVLNLASRTLDEIPAIVRSAVEGMASQIAGALARVTAENALRESEQNLQAMFDALNDLVFIFDHEGSILHTNPAARRRLGYTAEEILGLDPFEVHPPERRGEAALIIAGIVAGEVELCAIPLQAKDGTIIPAETHVTQGRWSERDVLFGVSRDMTEHERIEERLRDELSFRTAVVDHAAEGLCVCHQIPDFPHVCFTVWNERIREITGYTMEEINRTGWYQTMYPDPEVSERARLRMEGMRLGDDIRAEEWDIVRADGKDRTFSISTSIVKDDGGTPHVLAMMLDLTDRKRATTIIERHQQVLEETVARRTAELQMANEALNLEIGERKRTEAELHELATRDSLTGALTRRRFFDLAEQIGKQARRYGHSLAALMIDVDNFKAINDEHGHGVGDETLVGLVGLIRQHVREVDILGRYGGDELVILMPETVEGAAVRSAERLCGLVRGSTSMGGRAAIQLSVSIGVAVFDTGGDESIEDLVFRADGAMYLAKQGGRDRVCRWTPDGCH